MMIIHRGAATDKRAISASIHSHLLAQADVVQGNVLDRDATLVFARGVQRIVSHVATQTVVEACQILIARNWHRLNQSLLHMSHSALRSTRNA